MSNLPTIGISLFSGDRLNLPVDIYSYSDSGEWDNAKVVYVKESDGNYSPVWTKYLPMIASPSEPVTHNSGDIWIETGINVDNRLLTPLIYQVGKDTDAPNVGRAFVYGFDVNGIVTFPTVTWQDSPREPVSNDGNPDGTLLLRKKIDIPFYASVAEPVAPSEGAVWFASDTIVESKIKMPVIYNDANYEEYTRRTNELIIRDNSNYAIDGPTYVFGVDTPVIGSELIGDFYFKKYRPQIYTSAAPLSNPVNGDVWLNAGGNNDVPVSGIVHYYSETSDDGKGNNGDITLPVSKVNEIGKVEDIRIVDTVPNSDNLPDGTIYIVK